MRHALAYLLLLFSQAAERTVVVQTGQPNIYALTARVRLAGLVVRRTWHLRAVTRDVASTTQ